MIRRKVDDLLAKVEGRSGLATPIPPKPALLEDAELTVAKPDFSQVLSRIGKPGKRFQVLMEPTVTITTYHDHANGTLLTMKQVGRLFGVTPMTLYHWIKKLGMPKLTLGGGKNPPVRFDEGELLEWARQMNRAVVNTDYLEWQ